MQAQKHCAGAGARALCGHRHNSTVQVQVREQCAGGGRCRSTVRVQAQGQCVGAGTRTCIGLGCSGLKVHTQHCATLKGLS